MLNLSATILAGIGYSHGLPNVHLMYTNKKKIYVLSIAFKQLYQYLYPITTIRKWQILSKKDMQDTFLHDQSLNVLNLDNLSAQWKCQHELWGFYPERITSQVLVGSGATSQPNKCFF